MEIEIELHMVIAWLNLKTYLLEVSWMPVSFTRPLREVKDLQYKKKCFQMIFGKHHKLYIKYDHDFSTLTLTEAQETLTPPKKRSQLIILPTLVILLARCATHLSSRRLKREVHYLIRSFSIASASNFAGSSLSSKEDAFFTINRNVQTCESL